MPHSRASEQTRILVKQGFSEQKRSKSKPLQIKELYEKGLKQPEFEASENAIKIVLPVFEKTLSLTEDERKNYKILSRTMLKSISEMAPYVTFGKSKTTHLLKEMSPKGVVKIEGRERGTKYVIK